MRTGLRTSSSLIIRLLYSWFPRESSLCRNQALRETAVMFSSQFTAGVFHVSLKRVSRTLRSPQFSFLLHKKNVSHIFSAEDVCNIFFLITFYALLLTIWVTCDDDVLDTFFFPSWELDTCLQTDFPFFSHRHHHLSHHKVVWFQSESQMKWLLCSCLSLTPLTSVIRTEMLRERERERLEFLLSLSSLYLFIEWVTGEMLAQMVCRPSCLSLLSLLFYLVMVC